MFDLREKIKNEYLEYLTEEEIKSLDNLDELELKILVNDIWDRYLEKNNGTLVMSVNPLILDIGVLEEINNNKRFKVLNRDKSNTTFGEIGFIIDIDWSDEEVIYLPNDLLKAKVLNSTFSIIGVYFIDCGEGKLSGNYEIAKVLADILNKEDITVYKRDKYKPTKDYYVYIARCLLTDYVTKRQINLSKIEELFTVYGEQIINAYKQAKKDETYSDEDFISQMFTYLDANYKNIIVP